MTDIEKYAQKILKENDVSEYAYWGVSGDIVVGDLKKRYPEGLKYPLIDIANAIRSLSKPIPLKRAPYKMVFDMPSVIDSIDHNDFENAKDDALETLINWELEFIGQHNIKNEDISTWTEKTIEAWDMMIEDSDVSVQKYNPYLDTYETCWRPSEKDLEQIRWLPTDKFKYENKD